MAATTKYKATSTKFAMSNNKLVPTMTKSDLVAKTALKSFVADQIESAAADSGLVNLQILIRKVVVDE